jgi:hypothetical protein
MAGDARQAALTGPAPVSVHDDGDVPREAGEIQLLEQLLLLATGGRESR